MEFSSVAVDDVVVIGENLVLLTSRVRGWGKNSHDPIWD